MTRRSHPSFKHVMFLRVLCVAAAPLSAAAAIAVDGTVARADQPLAQEASAARPVTSWAQSVHDALARNARAAAATHRVFTQTGLASWYGHDFAGKKTSSGVRFDPMQLTCAHRTLPLGTRLLVTSHETGRSVVVTVNDRGPYAGPDRIIDLSRAAASRLGMIREGLNSVTLRRITPEATDTEVAEAPSADSSAQAITAAGDTGGAGSTRTSKPALR